MFFSLPHTQMDLTKPDRDHMPNQIMQLKASVHPPVKQIEAMKIIKEMSA